MSVGPNTRWATAPGVADLLVMSGSRHATPATFALARHLDRYWPSITTITGMNPWARVRGPETVIVGESGMYVLRARLNSGGEWVVTGSHDLGSPVATVKIEPRRRP